MNLPNQVLGGWETTCGVLMPAVPQGPSPLPVIGPCPAGPVPSIPGISYQPSLWWKGREPRPFICFVWLLLKLVFVRPPFGDTRMFLDVAVTLSDLFRSALLRTGPEFFGLLTALAAFTHVHHLLPRRPQTGSLGDRQSVTILPGGGLGRPRGPFRPSPAACPVRGPGREQHPFRNGQQLWARRPPATARS